MVLYLDSICQWGLHVELWSHIGTSQYHRTFVPLSVSLWNVLADLVFDGVGLAGFKTMANAFLLA